MGAVEPGVKIAGGMLTVDEESKAQDSHRNNDEMCMELLKEVGNGIHKSILYLEALVFLDIPLAPFFCTGNLIKISK